MSGCPLYLHSGTVLGVSYETAEQAGTCWIHDTLPEDAVPEPLRAARNRAKGYLLTE